MSFMIRMKKNEQGSYDLDCTTPETLPDRLEVSGHVQENVSPDNELLLERTVVDLTVRADNLTASSSRRPQYFAL